MAAQWAARALSLIHIWGIWEWGVVQTVATAFVFLQIGQEEAGRRMLEVAAHWSAAGKFPDESR